VKPAITHITKLIKCSAFALALITILLQPIVHAMFILNNNDIEVAKIDFEQDSEEKEESKEDDTSNEKIELQQAILQNKSDCFMVVNKSYQNQNLLKSYSPEILIPPPEQV